MAFIVFDLKSEAAWVPIPLGYHFVTGFFSRRKASDANIVIIVNVVNCHDCNIRILVTYPERHNMKTFVGEQ